MAIERVDGSNAVACITAAPPLSHDTCGEVNSCTQFRGHGENLESGLRSATDASTRGCDSYVERTAIGWRSGDGTRDGADDAK